jgi:hypothetical protein
LSETLKILSGIGALNLSHLIEFALIKQQKRKDKLNALD